MPDTTSRTKPHAASEALALQPGQGGSTPPKRAGSTPPRLFSRDKQHPPEERQSPKVAVVNAANETIREIQLSPDVFAATVNPHLVY